MITLARRVPVSTAIVVSSLLAGTAWAESHRDLDFAAGSASNLNVAVAAAQTQGSLALRTELSRAFAPGSAEFAFYEARGFVPLWLTSTGEAESKARALLAWVGHADANALPAGRYDVTGLAARLAAPGERSGAETAGIESALTKLFLSYSRDLSSGLLEPRRVSRSIHVKPRRPDPAVLLTGLATAPDAAVYFDSLMPAHPDYRELITLYAQMREIERSGGWGEKISRGRTLRPGDRHPRVEQLRTRLTSLGDMTVSADDAAIAVASETTVLASNEVVTDADPAGPDLQFFDPALEAAVKHFQTRHGLNIDGVVGPATLGGLNTTAAERAMQVAVNLERLRWLNRDLGSRHVVINIAGFTMSMYENGKPLFTTRTVVGKARRHQTPEFNDELEFMVVNPTWNVPSSIARDEILPKLQEDPTYLERHNMALLNSDLPASEIDWNLVTPGTFPGRIRQRPGSGNALGHVKFLFPNQYSIYMHDTPSRRLFSRDRRDFSHGCVRLQDPYGFAELLLSLQDDAKDDPAAEFNRLRARRGEQWVEIDRPIPVYVTYRTVWVDADGKPQFRADIYRRDRATSTALAGAGVSVGG